MRLTLEPHAQIPNKALLADPGLAHQQHHLALALLGSPPALEQQSNLVFAADKRRQARSVQRLEPTLGGAFRNHAPSPDRNGKALERVEAEFGEIEQAPDQLPGAGCDHY